MASEIADFTNPPPPLPRPSRSRRIIRLRAPGSGRRNRFRRVTSRALWLLRQPSGLNSRFQASIHGNQVQSPTGYEPLTELATASLLPHRANSNDPDDEKELLLMWLILFGARRWGRIARYLEMNNTPLLPQQAQSNTQDLITNPPSTYPYFYYEMNPTMSAVTFNNASDHMSMNENPMVMGAPASFSYPVMPANDPPTTLMLFPEESHFFPVPPAEEYCTCNSPGFQTQTSAASTSMTASDEVNLELTLG